ncbi:MAG: metallophosphoesterase [Chloroflexota bacterium]
MATYAAIAVTADIEAWHPDLVIVGGDIVNHEPMLRECLDFVLERELSLTGIWIPWESRGICPCP